MGIEKKNSVTKYYHKGDSMKKHKTVKQAVLEVIIKYYPKVPNYKIATAHPEHPMSGLQRLRELSARKEVFYYFDRATNNYRILTALSVIKRYLEKMKEL